MPRETRKSLAVSDAVGSSFSSRIPRRKMKSVMIVVETEASPEEVVLIVAARMPETIRPANPEGSSVIANHLVHTCTFMMTDDRYPHGCIEC